MYCLKSIFRCCGRGAAEEGEAPAPAELKNISSPTDYRHVTHVDRNTTAPEVFPAAMQPRPTPVSEVPSSKVPLDESPTLVTGSNSTSAVVTSTKPTNPPATAATKDASMPRTTPSGAGLPKTWIKDMDRYIAYLDGAGEVDYKVIAMKLKAKFPELGPYSITGDIVDRRLKYLEYQSADYFDKDETEGMEASASAAGFREGLEVAKATVKHNTGQELDAIEPVDYDKYIKRPAPTGPAKGGILKKSTSERSVQSPPITALMPPSTSKNSLTATSIKQTAYGKEGVNRKENEPLSEASLPANLGMTIKKVNRVED